MMNGSHWFISPSDEAVWEYRPGGKHGPVVDSMRFNHARLRFEDRSGSPLARYFEDSVNMIEAGAPAEEKGQARLAL